MGQYKEIELPKINVEVTDEEINEELKKVQEKNSRLFTVTDRAVKDGDEVVIDFEGFVDGEAFEGGKATDYTLKIGSRTFIDNFEEQLIEKIQGNN